MHNWSSPEGPGREHAFPDWLVTAESGSRPTSVRLQPDASLHPLESEQGHWHSDGEWPFFLVPLSHVGGRLAAGWYEVNGRLRSLEEVPLSASLAVGYEKGDAGDSRMTLPDADGQGRMRCLLLFKYDVTDLRFSPALGKARFGMEGFSLRRISRVRALRHMLLSYGAAYPGLAGVVRRSAGFVRNALRSGVSSATDTLFRAYRHQLVPSGLDGYGEWSSRFDAITADTVPILQERASALEGRGPLFSIIVPVYNTPERWLRRCIESVIAQAYPEWQLCIADDASSDEKCVEVIHEYAVSDSRIEVVRRDRNGHISAASNTALDMARGEFLALLDHDDELRPHALLEMAEAIARRPGVELLYSDEDKIDEHGRRFDPYFKPGFDPDLLRSQNYVCHLTVIRTSLVRAVGGFREGFEGSQDHDLILRCIEQIDATQVQHIPRVLYHWRAIPGSTALSRDAKDYASSAGVRAVADHLSRCHPDARAEELSHGHYRVRWPLPKHPPKVSLIVPTRDKADLLRMCVDSILLRSTYPDFEIVVVDNQSSEQSALDYLASLENAPQVKVLRYDAPFNYSALNNWAVSQCDGAVIGLVNNDIEVITPDWLEEMVSQALRPEVGAVGAMLYYPDDSIQHAGVILGIHGVGAHVYAKMPRGYPGHGGRARVAQSLSAVTAACLLVRREAYEEVGGLDERLRVAFNDVDFCLRLREAGYRNIWTPFAELYHHESASRGSEDTEDKKRRFLGEVEFMQERWGQALLADPAYNPNLSLNDLHCGLPVPPRLPPPSVSVRESMVTGR